MLGSIPWVLPFLFHTKSVITIYQTTKNVPNLEVNLKMMTLHMVLLFLLVVTVVIEMTFVTQLAVVIESDHRIDQNEFTKLKRSVCIMNIVSSCTFAFTVFVMLYFFIGYGKKHSSEREPLVEENPKNEGLD